MRSGGAGRRGEEWTDEDARVSGTYLYLLRTLISIRSTYFEGSLKCQSKPKSVGPNISLNCFLYLLYTCNLNVKILFLIREQNYI